MRKPHASIILLQLFFLGSWVAFGQSAGVGTTAATSGNEYLQKQNAVDDLGNVNSDFAIFGVPLPPASLEGDFYLNSDFRPGRFELSVSPKVYADMNIRYDLRNNLIEINYDDGIRGLDGNKVKYFELMDAKGQYTRYIHVNRLGLKGNVVPDDTFLQVIIADNIPLYSYEKVYIKKADYNVALNIGNRNDQIYKKPVYVSVVNGEAVELSKGKNSNVFTLLPGKEAELKAYAKENKIKVKELEDYLAIIRKMNSMK